MAGGDRVGNGGDVIVCGNKVELLDVYEAKMSNHTLYRPVGKDYKQMFQDIIQKHLSTLQPKRSARYLTNLNTFESEAQFLPGIELNDVDDGGMVAIPKKCKLKQIVIQLSDDERPAGKPRYTVSLDLWKKLDDFNKAALALHEIFYREAIEHQSSNSMVVRAMIGEVLSTTINLEIYLALDASFSEKIEFKNRTINVYNKSKTTVSLKKNEHQEVVLTLYGNLFFESEFQSVPKVIIRLSDGKVLEAGDYIRFIRANEKTDFNYGTITTDRDTDYENFTFKGLKDSTVKYMSPTGTYKLNFSHVNNFHWLILGSEKTNVFHGDFSLDFNSWTLSGNPIIVTFSTKGELISFSQMNFVPIPIRRNIFNCRGYSALASDAYRLRDCNQDSSFSIKIGTNYLPVMLASLSDILISKSTGDVLLQDYISFVLNDKKFLGLDYVTSKEVYLEPGSYSVVNTGGTYAFPYRILGVNTDYDIDNDGKVVVHPH